MNDAFFIGWTNRVPPGMRLPLLSAAAGVLAVMLAIAALLGRAGADPGSGNWAGEATLHATFTALPYPLLRVPPDAAHPQGHTVLLSAFGKAQVANAAALDGQPVQASGALIARGDLQMLVVNDSAQLYAAPALPPPDAAVKLGRWRIAGEICDGTCAAGAMRPGAGIAHRACASLCLEGDIPPLLVSVQPAAGSSFFLLAGADGGPIPQSLRRLTGVRLRLDGELERRGDLLVFRVDPASAEIL